MEKLETIFGNNISINNLKVLSLTYLIYMFDHLLLNSRYSKSLFDFYKWVRTKKKRHYIVNFIVLYKRLFLEFPMLKKDFYNYNKMGA